MVRYAATHDMIESVGTEKITLDDTRDIEATNCINCGSTYSEIRRILFVCTRLGKVLWWHVEHCNAH